MRVGGVRERAGPCLIVQGVSRMRIVIGCRLLCESFAGEKGNRRNKFTILTKSFLQGVK